MEKCEFCDRQKWAICPLDLIGFGVIAFGFGVMVVLICQHLSIAIR